MAVLKGSQTEENLKIAFASEAQANRRYLYFANQADLEEQVDVAALFRSTAQGETGHAHGMDNPVKTSALHFVRFEFSPDLVTALKSGAGARLGCDHPHDTTETPIEALTLASRLTDLH